MANSVGKFSIGINVNNRGIVETELKKKKKKILISWGIKWQEIVTKIITQKKIIDTGALKMSMTYNPPKDSTIQVGTVKKYAVIQELGSSKQQARPFLKPSVIDYKDTYKNIAESILRE